MAVPVSDHVKFYMTVCPCEETLDKEHISKHNSFVAVRIVELLFNAGFISKDIQIGVTSCCSEKNLLNEKPDHKKHYIILQTDKAVLRHFVAALNQGFSGVLSDETNEGISSSKCLRML